MHGSFVKTIRGLQKMRGEQRNDPASLIELTLFHYDYDTLRFAFLQLNPLHPQSSLPIT